MSTFVPTGTIELIRNVDIDSSYTHQYYFESESAQATFFSGKVFATLSNSTYQRKNSNTIHVPYEMDTIADCKYLRWKNTDYSNKWYYAFVVAIDYINPGVSQITYELDVYQTFLFNMTWKQSFIEREHTQRWTTDTKSNTIPVVNTEPEGLEYGSEYKILTEKKLEQIPDVGWIVFGSTKLPTSVPRQIGTMPTGIIYTFVPICTNQKKDMTFKVGNYTLLQAHQVLNLFATNTNLVNSLVSCIYYPFLPLYGVNYSMDNTDPSQPICTLSFDSPVDTYTLVSGADRKILRFTGLYSSAHNFIDPIALQDDRYIYQDFPAYTESKLLMFPYSFMELTTKRGDSLVVRMEYLEDRLTGTKLRVGAFGTISSVNKMTYALRNYLSDINGYNLSTGLNDASNSNLPITDDYTASYMQANSNSLRVAESNARYSQLTDIDNAYRSYETAMAKRTASAVKGGASAIEQVGSGAMMGLVGALIGSPGMAVGGASGMAGGLTTGIGTIADLITSEQQANTDYWNKYWSATTDYANTQASIMAKKNDAKQIPPSSKNLGGDYLFNMANDCNALYLRRKTIYPEYADKLTSFFKQYGYKVNKLEVPAFHTRTNWNYIKMAEPNVYGNIPMDDLMKIRDIFIKGITLWHGDYIGNYSLTNAEIS